ncbi:metallophosphoesterase, calcineurin superfamily [Thermococcus kodakarensis KOD1]|uniref:Metallophosphoesterase, calcineurin superfamily n=1 Tax=Thermococcus kodakarensis (strain ATCC BAA-918 / JCM 12380 / KOD1) TaxID=69014 RepID=Q5JF36_THEKO|nr:metallophosphoesterase [Thermococcus kodakarensis]WCN28599.1 metallophosphoesterase [Thermococcus kodakarensis]WCN30897.1 metallophosphoesterase [Thermococcus kodakarensis]BAD84736.1 metallophosphoesterase, calcineurin superfamily [Thermococcus kodakarensis KOD1]
MRIVAVTDIHGKLEKVKRLAGVLEEERPDLILIAGDITNFSGAEVARTVLEPLMALDVPILAVHGNCDGRDVPELLEELGISLHNKRKEVNGTGFVGVGGSNITPFNTIWELTEDEIMEILRKNYRPGDIILSHAPPKDTKADRVHSGLHVGSTALREFIEKNQPPLVVTGHIHEARSVDELGETIIVNPGPLFRGYYAVIDFDEKEKVVKNIELREL